jgi:Tol biopolymer transport system component
VPGGQPRRIGNLGAYDATWSPDGSKLYFCGGGGSIYSAEADGSDVHKLLTVKGYPLWIRFSPDGRVLRFSVLADPNRPTSWMSLWEAQADGSHLHQLLPGFANPASDCCGSWTPNGKYFVFQATLDGTSALWAMREGGDLWHKVSRAPVRLTQGVMGAYSPLPGKDGKIYFVGAMPRGELTRYDPKTRSLSPFLGGISASDVNFSKDGKRLAFATYPGHVLWYGNSDGSGLRQITFPRMQASQPRISPDGSQIAFTANMPGKPEQIYVIPVDGGYPEAITSGSQDSEDATWSPSGDALLYGPSTKDTTKGPTALHIVNLKTRVVTAVPGSGGLFSARWSPDGGYLVAKPFDNSRLKLYDLNLQTWKDLVGDISVAYHTWTQDSKCVVFGFSKGKTLWADRVCLADRKVQPIADMTASGNLVFDSESYGWTGLAPDGSILALRDISTQEIYALDVKWP